MLSPWHDNITTPIFPRLESDTRTSVLIIGGGITGILTAYFLHRQGIPYLLVEKDKICAHTTGNTTAKLTFQHSLIFHKLLKSRGKYVAQMYYGANADALAMYHKMCRHIDCDFQVKTNYVYSLDNPKKLEKELEAAGKLGIDMSFTHSVTLPMKTVGAVYCENQAQFNPLKFLSAISHQLNIRQSTHIKRVEGNTAYTDSHKIKADTIVFATHFPFVDRYGGYFMKMHQSRSYVIALDNAEDVGGMYIDESDKGVSFRNYGDLLFIGGNNHRTGKSCGAYEPLRDFAKAYYPHSRQVYHWAAQDCMTLDSMPYIGKYSNKTANWYTATGYNKWGMTGAMAGAMILRDMICGVENSYSEIFLPNRSIQLPQLLANGIETAVSFLTPTVKRCSHLGCALKYNKYEHSWDCPCHGSRYDKKGRVIENPANKDINIRD